MINLEYITRNTSNQNANACVIWLHGLGADCHDFEQILPVLNLPKDQHIRFIFPNAPERSITLNSGLVCRAWYDIYSLTNLNQEDQIGIEQSQQAINALIQQQVDDGIATNRIILAGFSQGGAMALYTGLTHRNPIAGIIALSCYLPLHQSILNPAHTANKTVPIRQCHGQFDDVLAFDLGRQSFNLLLNQAYNIDFHSYPIGHQVAIDELQGIGQWINDQLKRP